MYPLDRSYEEPIWAFIGYLKNYEALRVETNAMSTQVFGEYDTLMQALQVEIKRSFSNGLPCVMVLKVIGNANP